MDTKQYTLKSDDRWDNIAQLAYGVPGKIEDIVALNPNVLITAVIPAGTILNIPVVEAEDAIPAAELLPPWLR